MGTNFEQLDESWNSIDGEDGLLNKQADGRDQEKNRFIGDR